MRDGRIGLIILAAGIAPVLIKKSKPLARYLGDHFIRVGEYLKSGTDAQEAAGQELTTEKVAEPASVHEASHEKPTENDSSATAVPGTEPQEGGEEPAPAKKSLKKA